MSRARNIKPGFFKNDRLAECDPLARILFAALWCEADREGRLEDRPKRIKAECLPYDDADVDALLEQLARAGFIARYCIGEARYIAVLNFAKHQNPHVKEAASIIPAPDGTGLAGAGTGQAPDEHSASTGRAQCKHSASTVQAPDENGTSPADSLLLIPDSKNPPPTPRKRGAGVGSASRLKVVQADDRFAEFWQAYPRKVAKPAAEKAWRKVAAEADAIMAGLGRAVGSEQWRKDGGQFIPHPATWLNGRRWEDSIAVPSVVASGYFKSSEAEDAFSRQMREVMAGAL